MKAGASPLNAPTANLRLELQGLRAVAITAVLLFHQWSSVFKTGYLGVDVFFVISGYLMCHLLSRRMPLGAVEIVDFYFRRIKRIVPIYLFVVGLTVFVAKHYVSPLDYQQLVDEAVPSLFFYSNFPSVHKTEYFDFRSKYFFFLHTWSLSVEMQFYLLVPLLFLAAQRIRRSSVIWAFGFFLFVASFLRQCLAEGVERHMPLDGRIWQFMGGFVAHYLHQNFTVSDKVKKLCRKPLMDVCIIGMLSTILFFELTSYAQISRFCIILVAALFVSLPNNESSWLSTSALVSLGDASYSIYLIHWPIFTLHRFIDEELYAAEKEAPLIVGTSLIVVSVIIGFSLERAWSHVSRHLKTWSSLIITVMTLYAAIGIILLNVSKSAVQLGSYSNEIRNSAQLLDNRNNQSVAPLWIREDGSVNTITMHVEELWANRYSPKALNAEQALSYNQEAIAYKGRDDCPNGTFPMLKSLHISYGMMGFFCTEKGTGTKNIVIIGNSHVVVSFYGLRYHLRDLAANIWTRAMAGCVPHPLEYQEERNSEGDRKNCVTFINSTIEMLQQWEQPIDIIIVLYGYGHIPDPGPTTNWETDPLFVFTQDYYRKLSEIAQEAVFIPSMNIWFDKNPLKAVSDKLLKTEPIREMGESRKKQLSFASNVRQRIEHINCPNNKCILMNWHNLWCRENDGNFCRSVEPISHISYFLDEHHLSPYGSMFLGEYLRQQYQIFAEKAA